jgi:hypothetical protein
MTLEDAAGDYYTGNELIYYPELTKKLRKMKHYPVVKYTFKMDTEIEGVAFINYFHRRVLSKITSFEKRVDFFLKRLNNLLRNMGDSDNLP